VNQRDQLAFAALWRRHHAKSLQFARGIVRNDADAQEVAQDAWFNAWRHLPRFELEAQFSPWLMAIVRNLSLMKLRSQRGRQFIALESERPYGGSALRAYMEGAANPERAFEQSHLRRFVLDQIARLPQPYRECLVAAYLEESPVADAADRLGLTESALKGRLRRGKAELGHRIARQLGRFWKADPGSDSSNVTSQPDTVPEPPKSIGAAAAASSAPVNREYSTAGDVGLHRSRAARVESSNERKPSV
jgi:RNA polymerase sigma-70 factor (ECF subfamily)